MLDFSRVPFMDVSAALAVETVAADAARAGRTVYCSGMRQEVRAVLANLGADTWLPPEHRFERRIDALRAAVGGLEERASTAEGRVAAADAAPG